MFDFTPPRQAQQRELVRTVTKLTLIAVWLIVLVAVVRHLPGIHYVIPRTPITLAATVSAGATVVIVGVLLLIAPNAASLVLTSLAGPADAVQNVASVAYWGVVLVAVVVAHRGLAGLLVPMLGNVPWLYDTAFLVLSLPPMLVIAARLFDTVDPAADHVTDRMIRSERAEDEA